MRLLALALLALATPAAAQTLAEVGGVPITLAQVQAANPDPTARADTIIALINRQTVLNDAARSGLTKTPEYAAALAQAQTAIILNLAAQNFVASHPVSDQDAAQAYAKLFPHPPATQYHVREILTATYADAQAAITRLQQGEDFSTLAAQVSQDPSAALGGELGWQTPDQLPAPLMQALKPLTPGQAAGPIALPQGYAVLQLLGIRLAPQPPFDQVKPKIVTAIQQQEWIAHIISLRTAQHAVLLAPLPGK